VSKYIVTTTIHHPTKALKLFASMPDWKLIVVGDKKTPIDAYKDFNCIYLSPEYQESTYPKLSDAIGWNCIMRRNFGFIEAYKLGAEIVATVDDDNIPYPTWGKDVRVGTRILVDEYCGDSSLVFDPLQLTNHKELWYRGFPLEYIKYSKNVYYTGKVEQDILVQADFWDGDPDVDAVCRKLYDPEGLKLELKDPFIAKGFTPFNSQNTFIYKSALRNYMCLPHVGRMDDIWGGYLLQHRLGVRVLYMPATVFQLRNPQFLDKNFKDEVMGYTETETLLNDINKWREILPKETVEAFDLYQAAYV
jgi:hypothetical protein